MNQNLSPKYYPNNKLSKAITNCEQLSSSNRCLVNSKIILWGIRKFKVESLRVLGHPRSNMWSSGMSVKDTSRELNFCFPYQKTCPCQSEENVKRQLLLTTKLSPSKWYINDFKIDRIGHIIKIKENEIQNLLVYFRWKQLYVAAGIR